MTTLLNLYNNRAFYKKVTLQYAPITFTGKTKGSGQNIEIEVKRGNKKSWEMGNCMASAK